MMETVILIGMLATCISRKAAGAQLGMYFTIRVAIRHREIPIARGNRLCLKLLDS